MNSKVIEGNKSYVIVRTYVKISDFIKISTYILMDNFCPCSLFLEEYVFVLAVILDTHTHTQSLIF